MKIWLQITVACVISWQVRAELYAGSTGTAVDVNNRMGTIGSGDPATSAKRTNSENDQVVVIKDIAYLEPNRSERLDLYYRPSALNGPRVPGIVIVHGGGWRGGDKARSREINIANTLVPAGYVCASINYKLAGSKTPSWPKNIQDCMNAAAFLRSKANVYNIDANNIGAIGGSAGGHLVSLLGTVDANAQLDPAIPYPNVSKRVQAVVDMYGITDLFTRQDTDANGNPIGGSADGGAVKMFGCSKGDCPALWTLGNPVSHIDAGDPPFLILHGKADTTVDYLQSIELNQRLVSADVYSDLHLLEGVGHTFDLEPKGYDLRPVVIQFLNKFLKGR